LIVCTFSIFKLIGHISSGKTLEFAALVLLNKRNSPDNITRYPLNGITTLHDIKTTLVICPKLLLHQWDKELRQHCDMDHLSITIYTGVQDLINTLQKNDPNVDISKALRGTSTLSSLTNIA